MIAKGEISFRSEVGLQCPEVTAVADGPSQEIGVVFGWRPDDQFVEHLGAQVVFLLILLEPLGQLSQRPLPSQLS